MINEYYACYSLTSVKMSNILKTIERWAFIRCNSLTNISIPKTVTNIEYNVLGCVIAFHSKSNQTSSNVLAKKPLIHDSN